MERRYWPRQDKTPFQLEPLERPTALLDDFSNAMSALDIIHLCSGEMLKNNGTNEQLSVKIKDKHASNGLLDAIGRPRTATMVVTFDNGDKRRVSVRNGTLGVLFLFDKEKSSCSAFKERNVDNSWLIDEPLDLETNAILPLLQIYAKQSI